MTCGKDTSVRLWRLGETNVESLCLFYHERYECSMSLGMEVIESSPIPASSFHQQQLVLSIVISTYVCFFHFGGVGSCFSFEVWNCTGDINTTTLMHKLKGPSPFVACTPFPRFGSDVAGSLCHQNVILVATGSPSFHPGIFSYPFSKLNFWGTEIFLSLPFFSDSLLRIYDLRSAHAKGFSLLLFWEDLVQHFAGVDWKFQTVLSSAGVKSVAASADGTNPHSL